MNRIHTGLVALLALTAGAAGGDEPKNLLFFGNSFTGSGGGVHRIVQDIAEAAGHARPHVYGQVIGGVSLEFHLQNSTAVITNGIPPGRTWDHVVMQEYSTRPTTHPTLGDPQQFFDSSAALYQQVLNHSSDAKAVLFETWARAPGHSFYPGIWNVPAEMQAELRTNYGIANDNLNAAHGDGSSEVASVGDAFELGAFDVGLYGGDLYHASNRGALLISLVLYGTIYDDVTTGDIDLGEIAAGLGLDAQDIAIATDLADRTLVPAPGALAPLAMGGLLAARRRR